MTFQPRSSLGSVRVDSWPAWQPSVENRRIFAQVATSGSVTAAARALGIPKQTVSRRLSALEEELGVSLLQRNTRRVRLTELGASYALRCQEIARLAEEADRAVKESTSSPQGVLRVTADPVFEEACLRSGYSPSKGCASAAGAFLRICSRPPTGCAGGVRPGC